MSAEASVILPGRLGTPGMTLGDDPRADPRMVATLASLGMLEMQPLPVDGDSPLEALRDFLATTETGLGEVARMLLEGLPPVEGVDKSVEIIVGVDGNDITLHIERPTGVVTPVPGVLHLHGGGMAMEEAATGIRPRWREELAATGLVVVGVEFRNSAGKLGPYPFPAGLNDCSSALEWVSNNRGRLGISRLIILGESGGGNLTLATTLKAKRDGRVSSIDGVYAQCPYISNAYTALPPDLPSLQENDGYMLSVQAADIMARAYDPTGDNATNPLAWPLFATTDDLSGLPPHVISVNQLDLLRDEGLAYYRKLLDAGVSAVSRTVNGTCHGGDMLFPATLPDVYMATIRDINGFATSL